MKISEAISIATKKMEGMSYSMSSINFHVGVWNKFRTFLAIYYQSDEFDPEVIPEFLEKEYHVKSTIPATRPSERDSLYLSAMSKLKVLPFSDVTYFRRKLPNAFDALPSDMKEIISSYKKTLVQSGLRETSIRKYISNVTSFLTYCVKREITNINQITEEICVDYLDSYRDCSKRTVSNHTKSLKKFMLFLDENNYYHQKIGLLVKAPVISSSKDIPSVFSIDEIKAILIAIDRESPVGKRDYAMILLAATSLLRISDIKGLKFSNIDWEKKQINLVQHKTKNEITNPISLEAGWALIDYIKNGRPKVNTDYIFVNHRAPYRPLAVNVNNNCYNIIQKYTRKAGIATLNDRHSGFHTLRHAAASQLLQEGTPLPIITSILGHTTTASTAVYLKTDVEHLRKCVLPLEGICDEELCLSKYIKL